MIEITDNDNLEITSVTTVLDFYSPSCMPCKKMMPIVESIEEDTENYTYFYKIDATENPELVKRFDVMSLPTIIILQGGVVEEKFTGIVSKSAIMKVIDSWKQ